MAIVKCIFCGTKRSAPNWMKDVDWVCHSCFVQQKKQQRINYQARDKNRTESRQELGGARYE